MSRGLSKIQAKYFKERYEEIEDFQEIFSLVKEGVQEVTGRSRAGLMLGLADLGVKQNGFIGAFYPVGTNVIVLNKTPLKMIEAQKPDMLKPYVFHVLMHEYLHTLGVLNERHTELFTMKINEKIFGEEHPVTRMSFDFDRLFPNVVMPEIGMQLPTSPNIELVDDFERMNYIG